MENKNINIEELKSEMAELKTQQKAILKARFLNVAELNKVNKRLYEIRQTLKQCEMEEEKEDFYIY